MSGRAVGGAAGAGCGVFTIVGVLLGVGLVVWLGSSIVPSGGGDGGSGGGAEVGLSPDDVADLGIDQVVPTEVTGTGVSLTDDGSLDDGESVFVDGSGFAPGTVELTVCLTDESRVAGGLAGCDPATATTVEVGDDGVLDAGYQVQRVITVSDVAYDCAAVSGGCSLVAAPPGAPDQGPAAPLLFAAGLPPVDAQPPPQR